MICYTHNTCNKFIQIKQKDMDDRALITLAAIEDHSAREEILKRHIMDVDNVDYKQANKTFNKKERTLEEGLIKAFKTTFF